MLTESLFQSPPQEPPRKRWTRAERAALESVGLVDQQHVELIEGELITKVPKKRPHSNAQTLMLPWFLRVFGERFVNTDSPIDVAPEDNPTNEPEPDIIVLKQDSLNFQSAYPRPENLHLLVEIADTTLLFDLTAKAGLYARATIVEYWVLDVKARRLIVHRNPDSGKYAEITAYLEPESVAPLAAPHAEFRVDSAFQAFQR